MAEADHAMGRIADTAGVVQCLYEMMQKTYRKSVEPATRELGRLEKRWRRREMGVTTKAIFNARTALDMLCEVQGVARQAEDKLATASAAATAATAVTVATLEQRDHCLASAELQMQRLSLRPGQQHQMQQQLPPTLSRDNFEASAATAAVSVAAAAEASVRAALAFARKCLELAHAHEEEALAVVKRTAYLAHVDSVERSLLADEINNAEQMLEEARRSFEALAVRTVAARAEEVSARVEGRAAKSRCIVPYQDYMGAVNRTLRARETYDMSVGKGGDESAKTRCIVDRGVRLAADYGNGGTGGFCSKCGGVYSNGDSWCSNRGGGGGGFAKGGGSSNGKKRGRDVTDEGCAECKYGKSAGGARGAGDTAGVGEGETRDRPDAKEKGNWKVKEKERGGWGADEEPEDLFNELEQVSFGDRVRDGSPCGRRWGRKRKFYAHIGVSSLLWLFILSALLRRAHVARIKLKFYRLSACFVVMPFSVPLAILRRYGMSLGYQTRI